MRHVWSLLAGIVITPLAWMLIAYGQALTISDAAVNRADTTRMLGGGALLVAAGLLVGLISSLRVSPVGPLVPVIVYLGISVYGWLEPLQAGLRLTRFDWSVGGVDASLFTPIYTSVLPVLGGVLAVCAFSRQRWRGWPQPPAPALADPEQTAQVYGQLLQGRSAEEPTADLIFGPDPLAPPSPAATRSSATPTAGSGADAPSWPKPTGSQ